jgi:L-rhamnose mutarotase
MTRRVCFVLHVEPEHVEEYARRHAEVWPEMRQALTEAGWRNYSLHLAPGGTVIGHFECDDLEAAQAAMAATEVNERWQQEMQVFFAGNDRADTGLTPLPEIFHLA